MDNRNMGDFILKMRKENKMTQREQRNRIAWFNDVI